MEAHQIVEECDNFCNGCLMSIRGCKDAIIRDQTDKKCTGCDHIIERDDLAECTAWYCNAYANPSLKWRNDQICPLATHVKAASSVKSEKVRVGQQKRKKH